MFGKAIRAAMGFAGGMLMATTVMIVNDELVAPACADVSGASLICDSFAAVELYFPVLVLLGAVIGLVARGVSESNVA